MRRLELANPCDFTPENGSPTEEEHVLRCLGCGHTVRDLSAMNAADALAFLDRRRPGECVRFRVDEHERVRFADGAGSLIGRIARDAKPMIAVASLMMAACGEGHAPPAPSSSSIAVAPVNEVATASPAATSAAAITPVPPASAEPSAASTAATAATAGPTSKPAGVTGHAKTTGAPPAQQRNKKIIELAGF